MAAVSVREMLPNQRLDRVELRVDEHMLAVEAGDEELLIRLAQPQFTARPELARAA